MARLYLFVEGLTEQAFADTVLAPHLANLDVYLHPAVVIAHARRRGRPHRGGGRKYKPMRDDIERFTKQEKDPDVFFTSLIDLYAIAPDFPRLQEAELLRNAPYQRVTSLERAWAEDLPDRRFIPFIALHEFETFLFARPEEFSLFYPDEWRQIAELRSIADRYGNVELINDGAETAPSKCIIAAFPDYKNAKVAIGSQIAARIGLQVIREQCRHFNAWVRSLEQLAEAAQGGG